MSIARTPLRYLSLFTGVGLLDLGWEMALTSLGLPYQCVGQVEIDLKARKVLAKHWPHVEKFPDVTTFDATRLSVDFIIGGFPCQDVSFAGAGRGLSGERSGLWSEYLRIVRECRPRGVLIENVPGLIRRGLDEIVSGLADAGYTVEATRIQAADVGAPHRRERLFLVAYAHGVREPQPKGRVEELGRRPVHGGETLPNPDGLQAHPSRCGGAHLTGDVPSTQSRLGGDTHGGAYRLDGCQWPAGRGLDQESWEPPRMREGVRDRTARLAQLGNAVVPQCAYIAAHRLLDKMLGEETHEEDQ